MTTSFRCLEQVRQDGSLSDQLLISRLIGLVGDRTGENYAKPRQRRRQDHFPKGFLTVQVIGEARVLLVAAESHSVANRSLRIDVHNESFQPTPRERGREVHRGCGLAYSTFLADDRENIAHLLGDLWVFAASQRPTVRGGWSGANPLERLSCVSHPALGFCAWRRWVHEKGLKMEYRVRCIAAAEQQESQAIVRAGELWLDVQSATVTPYRFGLSSGARIRDRHVLENAVIGRLVAERELVRRQRGFVITLTFEREPLAQVVEALLLAL